MSRFARQISAAQRQYDNASPDESDDVRERWIESRADELVRERIASHDAVKDAVEDIIGNSDWTDALPGDMATVLTASGSSFYAEATRFFCRLYKRVEDDIRDGARLDAEHERERWEDEQAEMRNGRNAA